MNGETSMNRFVDFDLRGLAGVRLVDALPEDVRAVARQLGPIRLPPQETLARAPEITIRFVSAEQLAGGPPPDYVELARTAFQRLDDTGETLDSGRFWLLRGKHKTPARVQIPLDKVGGRCEILCQHGIAAVPFLIPILNLTVLANGALPLHAGAFIYRDSGTLVTGWSKGGKTEALLGFMARGATYVADEWTYLYDGGRCMTGIPEPVRIWDWHLREMPQYRQRLSRKQRLRLTALSSVQRGLKWLAPSGDKNGAASGPLAQLHRVIPVVKKQQGVNVTPQRLFGNERWASSASVDRVFFVLSSEAPEIRVRALDPQEVAQRMVFSLQEEQRHLLSLYRQFRFAFPEAANEWIDCSQQIQAARLQEMLAGKETYLVTHPYPVPIEGMVAAMERVFR